MQSMPIPSNVVCDGTTHQPPQLPYTMIPCEVDSAGSPNSSWLGRVWGGDGSEFWKICHTNSNFNNGNSGHGRVSCSSLESGSSYEDINVDEVDDNNNSSNAVDGERFGGHSVAATTTRSYGHDDTNNNTTDWFSNNNNQEVDLNNDNENKDITKGTTNRTKNATPRTRVLDEEGYIRRAACVCVDETESKVLLVSSKKDPCSWLVPGGGVEVGEEMSTAAKREAWEEAGVQGHITRYLGLFETQHHSGRKRHRTEVYVVQVQHVLTQYPEAHLGRQREWFSVEEALVHLSRHRPLQSAYLQLLLVSRLKDPPT